MSLRFRLPLRDHQATEYWKYRDVKLRAKTWTMRAGKSKSCIDEASYLFYTDKIDFVIVIAPPVVYEDWVLNQIPTHSSVPYRSFMYRPEKVSVKKYAASFVDFIFRKTSTKHLKYFSISSTAIGTLNATKFLATIAKTFQGRILVVFDEVHQYSSVSSKKTKQAKSISAVATYKRIMTGTDTVESVMQSYSQYNLLEHGALGFKSLGEFEAHYGTWKKMATRGGRPYVKFTGTQNEEELASRMAKYTSYVQREDIKGLSKLLPITWKFELLDRQREIYKALLDNPTMEDELLDGGVLMLKLQQIASGFLNFKTSGLKEIVPFTENPRIALALHIIKSCDSKVLLWAHFTQEFEDLRKALDKEDIEYMEAHGKVLGKKNHLGTIVDFERSNSAKVILCHPKSISMGLNLSFLNSILWYSQNASNTSRFQCSERATTIDGLDVDVHDIIAHNTIDSYILDCRKRKLDVSQLIKSMSVAQLTAELRNG